MAGNEYTIREEFFHAADGIELFVKDYCPTTGSDKTPVIYFSGFMRTARDFDRVAVYLASERRIITVDTRGRGRSTRPRDLALYHFDLLVQDAWRLLDHLQVQHVVVVGIALGAFMALEMSAQHPERIVGIVSNDTGTETFSKASAKMRSVVDHRPHTLEEAIGILKTATGENFRDFSDSDWEAYALQVFAADNSGMYVRDFDPLVFDEIDRFKSDRQNFWNEFVAIGNVPVLILRGERSVYLSDEDARRMQQALPSAQYVEVPGRGHPLVLDESVSLAAIGKLLEAVDAAR